MSNRKSKKTAAKTAAAPSTASTPAKKAANSRVSAPVKGGSQKGSSKKVAAKKATNNVAVKTLTKKISTSDTGLGKNVANFYRVIQYCASLGIKYNPANILLFVAAMTILYNSALAAVAAVGTALAPYTPAQQARKVTYAGMKKILTRIAKSLAASNGVTPAQKAKCASLIRIVRSVRVVAIDPLNEDPNYISVSQQSFDNLYDHFQDLVSFIAGTSIYNTNIADVKLTALQSLLATMLAQNQAVINLEPTVTAARTARNHILYDATTGVVDTAMAAKAVIGSAYGPKTAEYKGVSGIAFTRPKKGTI